MISSKYRFIYLHVPKTGGNSIQTRLQPYSDDEFVIGAYKDGHDRFGIKGSITPRKHARLADYASILGSNLENYKTIVSVRNPLDRAVSSYFSPSRWMKRKGGTNEWAVEEPFWDLGEFEKCLEKTIPMIEFIKVNGMPVQPDHIIRFENLTENAKRCAAVLGLGDIDLPHVNKSSAREMAQIAVTNAAVRDLVAEHFAVDYRFFNY